MNRRERVNAIMLQIARGEDPRRALRRVSVPKRPRQAAVRREPLTVDERRSWYSHPAGPGDGRRRPLTEEHKAKLRAAKQGNRNAAGTRSPEQRAKIAASLRGNKNALGHKWTQEGKAHHLAAMARPETRAKLSAIHKGKPWSPARWAAQKLRQKRNDVLS